MLQKLHKFAKTNYQIRQYIQASPKPLAALARELSLNVKTVRKWKRRNHVADCSSKPHRLRTRLTPFEEDLIVYERKSHKKTLFEIWDALEGTIPNLYPMKIYRVCARWGLAVLPRELTEADRLVKRFKKYTVGYLHMDTVYTPKLMLPGGKKQRFYIFSCIDRVSKLAFVWVTDRRDQGTGAAFLRKVTAFYPYRINYILTDNGGEFTNKAYRAHCTLHIHAFDVLCRQLRISHRTIRFRHPWTNGMVERFNRKIKDNVVRRYLFGSVEDLEEKLITYLNRYNFELKLQQLDRETPVSFLEKKYRNQLTKHPQRIVN